MWSYFEEGGRGNLYSTVALQRLWLKSLLNVCVGVMMFTSQIFPGDVYGMKGFEERAGPSHARRTGAVGSMSEISNPVLFCAPI